MYSRHTAAAASAGGDVLAGEDFADRDPDVDVVHGGMDSRSAALERQREATLQRAYGRTTAVAGPTMSSPGLGGSRTLARGAPMLSVPRMDGLDDVDPVSGRPSSSSAGGRPGTGGGGGGVSNAGALPGWAGNGASAATPSRTGGGASLADALRRRGDNSASSEYGAGSGGGGGVGHGHVLSPAQREREMEAMGIASSYDPAVEASPARGGRGGAGSSSGGASASGSTQASRTSTSAAAAAAATGTGGKGELMPIAPLAPSMMPASPAREREYAAPLDFSDMRRFLTTPTPRSAGVVQCYIERDKSSIAHRLYPLYTAYMTAGDRFLMTSKKRANNTTSNYIISSDRYNLHKEAAGYIGKLRANFVGTEFVVYDDGQSPEAKSGGAGGGGGLSSEIRQELAVVNYASNVMGSRGPRKMRVAVPRVLPDGRRVVFQPDRDEDGMMSKLKTGHTQDMFTLVNKPPKWNDLVGAYVLNFSGRVTQASVKNFQLVSPDDHDTVVLQFGRTAKDTFTMDYQWPLSPLQAFAICLSSFDYKLACE